MNITLRNDGVAVASRDRFRLAMRHPGAASPTYAWSEDFDSLNELRRQMERLGYKLMSMGPAGAIGDNSPRFTGYMGTGP